MLYFISLLNSTNDTLNIVVSYRISLLKDNASSVNTSAAFPCPSIHLFFIGSSSGNFFSGYVDHSVTFDMPGCFLSKQSRKKYGYP